MAEVDDDSDVSDISGMTRDRRIYSLRCRLCRKYLLFSDKVRVFHETNPKRCGNCLYLNEDDLPSWIQDEVKLSGWTKGRIYCPKKDCAARIGGFDFVQGLMCACGVFTIPAIWIQGGKVDMNIISSSRKLIQPTNQKTCQRSQSILTEKPNKNGSIKPRLKERHSLSSVPSKEESEIEKNILMVEANSPGMMNSEAKYEKSLGIAKTRTTGSPSTGRTRTEENNEGLVSECKSVEIGRHSKCYRCTTVSRRGELLPSRNRFNNLKVEEPKLISKPICKEVGDHLVCPVCLDCFYKPYKCPCSHIFCEPCLRQLYHARSGTLKCPVCRGTVKYIEPANELRDELRKFHSTLIKMREGFEKTAKYKSWPLPPTDPLAFLKQSRPLVPHQDRKLIKLAGILLLIVCYVILYIIQNMQ